MNLITHHNIPLGFGKGHIGREMLKWSTDKLKEFVSRKDEDEPNKCGYNLMAKNIQQTLAKAVLERRL